MQDILNFAGYTVAFLTAALPVIEVAGAFFFPGSVMAKVPSFIKLVRGTIKLIKAGADAMDEFRSTLDQWEKERGGFSREPDPKIKQ